MQLDKNDSPNALLKTEQNVSLPTNILNSDSGLTPQSLQAFNAGKAADTDKYTQEGVIPKFDLDGLADAHGQTHDFSPPVKDRLDYADRHNKNESNPIKDASGVAAGASGGGAAGSGECSIGAAGAAGWGGSAGIHGFGHAGGPGDLGGYMAGGHATGKGDSSALPKLDGIAHPGGGSGGGAGKHPPESDGTTIEITVNHGNVILNDGTTHDGNLVFKGDAK